MPDVAVLSVRVDADTSAAERGIDSLGGKVGGIGGTLATAFGGAAVAGIAGVAAGLGAAVTSAAGFESTMSAVKAVSGATGEEMADLSGLALQLGKDTSFSASEAGKGIEELVKGGLTIPDIMNGAAKATLDLAAAGGVSLPEAATIAANALAQFNLKGEDMGHVADLIAGAANASALDVSDFSFSLKAAGAVASTVGFSFDDLAQGIAVMGKAGITGSDAGTSLKTMMLNLQPATNAQRDEFRRLGLETNNLEQGLAGLRRMGIEPTSDTWGGLNSAMMEHLGLSENVAKWTDKDHTNFEKLSTQVGATGSAFFDANGKVKSMADVAEVLKTSMDGMTEAQRLASLEILFGSDAIRAGAVLAKEGAAGFNDMAGAMGKVTAEAVGAEKLNNLAGTWEQLKGSLETAAITIGLSLMPVLTDLVKWATQGVNDIIPALDGLGKAFSDTVGFMTGDGEKAQQAFMRLSAGIERAFGPELSSAIINTLADIRATIDVTLRAINDIFNRNGTDLSSSWKSTWGEILKDALFQTQQLLAVIRVFALAATGDWHDVLDELAFMHENHQQRQVEIAERQNALMLAALDTFTGGALSKTQAWLSESVTAAQSGWRDIVDAVTRGTTDALRPIVDTWTAAQQVTETVFKAIENVLIAVWDAIYDSVIKPKLDAIAAVVASTWDAVKAKTSEVFDPLLAYVRDTIFEPLRAAIETKITAARDLFAQAVQAVSDTAHAVLDPVLSWWSDTIWEPMRAAVDTAVYGPKGAHTQFESGVGAIKGVVDGVLQSIKGVWEQTWAAIQRAAESPQAAMNEIIKLVDKLKSIMPEWLIPHSPTPFQIGLEGIMKAAKGMDSAFGGMGGGLEMIQQIGAMAASIGGLDFGRAAAAIAASETGGGRHLIQQGGGGGAGPFQFDPGGELQNFARSLHVSMAEAARIAVAEPGRAAAWALHGYLGDALRRGIENGLSGADLADFGSRVGQRPAGDNWKMAGEWFRRLFPGLAEGGIVTRPTLAMIGERGPEAVIPLTGRGAYGAPLQTIRLDVAIGGRVAEEIYVTGRELAIKRGRVAS